MCICVVIPNGATFKTTLATLQIAKFKFENSVIKVRTVIGPKNPRITLTYQPLMNRSLNEMPDFSQRNAEKASKKCRIVSKKCRWMSDQSLSLAPK